MESARYFRVFINNLFEIKLTNNRTVGIRRSITWKYCTMAFIWTIIHCCSTMYFIPKLGSYTHGTMSNVASLVFPRGLDGVMDFIDQNFNRQLRDNALVNWKMRSEIWDLHNLLIAEKLAEVLTDDSWVIAKNLTADNWDSSIPLRTLFLVFSCYRVGGYGHWSCSGREGDESLGWCLPALAFLAGFATNSLVRLTAEYSWKFSFKQRIHPSIDEKIDGVGQIQAEYA